jgi:hypothetical protein
LLPDGGTSKSMETLLCSERYPLTGPPLRGTPCRSAYLPATVLTYFATALASAPV